MGEPLGGPHARRGVPAQTRGQGLLQGGVLPPEVHQGEGGGHGDRGLPPRERLLEGGRGAPVGPGPAAPHEAEGVGEGDRHPLGGAGQGLREPLRDSCAPRSLGGEGPGGLPRAGGVLRVAGDLHELVLDLRRGAAAEGEGEVGLVAERGVLLRLPEGAEVEAARRGPEGAQRAVGGAADQGVGVGGGVQDPAGEAGILPPEEPDGVHGGRADDGGGVGEGVEHRLAEVVGDRGGGGAPEDGEGRGGEPRILGGEEGLPRRGRGLAVLQEVPHRAALLGRIAEVPGPRDEEVHGFALVGRAAGAAGEGQEEHRHGECAHRRIVGGRPLSAQRRGKQRDRHPRLGRGAVRWALCAGRRCRQSSVYAFFAVPAYFFMRSRSHLTKSERTPMTWLYRWV